MVYNKFMIIFIVLIGGKMGIKRFFLSRFYQSLLLIFFSIGLSYAQDLCEQYPKLPNCPEHAPYINPSLVTVTNNAQTISYVIFCQVTQISPTQGTVSEKCIQLMPNQTITRPIDFTVKPYGGDIWQYPSQENCIWGGHVNIDKPGTYTINLNNDGCITIPPP